MFLKEIRVFKITVIVHFGNEVNDSLLIPLIAG